MIALPTAYTARINAISNAQVPDALQLYISNEISEAIANGVFSTDIALDEAAVAFEVQIACWLKSLGYFVDYTDQPYHKGQIEVRWG